MFVRTKKISASIYTIVGLVGLILTILAVKKGLIGYALYGWFDLYYLERAYGMFKESQVRSVIQKIAFLSMEAVITLLIVGVILLGVKKVFRNHYQRLDEISAEH